MGQMAAVGQIHPQDDIIRIDQGIISSHIGLGAGMRLNIDMIGAKNFFSPLTGEIFHQIDALTAAIIAFARVTLGIFVGKHGTLGFHDRPADKVFRSDQFDFFLLPLQFHLHGPVQFRVHICQIMRKCHCS